MSELEDVSCCARALAYLDVEFVPETHCECSSTLVSEEVSEEEVKRKEKSEEDERRERWLPSRRRRVLFGSTRVGDDVR